MLRPATIPGLPRQLIARVKRGARPVMRLGSAPACLALSFAVLVPVGLTGCEAVLMELGDHTPAAGLNGSLGSGSFTLTGPGGKTITFSTVSMGLTMTSDYDGTVAFSSNTSDGTTPGAYTGTTTSMVGGAQVKLASGDHEMQFNLRINSEATQLQGTATYTAADGSQYTGTVTFNKVDTH